MLWPLWARGTYWQVRRNGWSHYSCACTFITNVSHNTCLTLAPGPHISPLPRCHHPLQTVPQTLHLLSRAAGQPVLSSSSSHSHAQPGQAFLAKMWSVTDEKSAPLLPVSEGEGVGWRATGPGTGPVPHCLTPAMETMWT